MDQKTERQLIQRAQAGEQDAIDALVAQHDRKLWHIARHTRARGETADDLHQHAVVFFLLSVQKYNLRDKRQVRLSTWTYSYVQRRVRNVAWRSGIVHLPPNAKATDLDAMNRALNGPSGIVPENEQRVASAMARSKQRSHAYPADFELREHRRIFYWAVKQLPERMQGIIEKRLAGETLEHVARYYCITRERVRQLQEKAEQRIARLARAYCRLHLPARHLTPTR